MPVTLFSIALRAVVNGSVDESMKLHSAHHLQGIDALHEMGHS